MHELPTTIKRLTRGLNNPQIVHLMVRNWAKMLKGGRVRPFVGSVFETLLTPDYNPYFSRLKEHSEGGLARCDVLDFEMYVDVDDAGLSRTLLQFGIREEVSTNVFREELQRLKRDVDGDVTVLEIGANIGYYTLLEASILEGQGNIYAIEPAPRNFDVLKQNIELNGMSDAVSTHQLALGHQNTQTRLYMAEKSNWHSPHRISDHSSSMETEMMTADTFLREHGVSPDSINGVRTDTEGFEVEIFQGMERILAAETPLLLFVELHPSLRESSELNRVLDQLERNNFRIVSTTLDVYGGRFDQDWYETVVGFESFEDIKRHHNESNAAVLLIAKREPPSDDDNGREGQC